MEKLKSKASFLYLGISMWRMKEWRKNVGILKLTIIIMLMK